MKYLIRILLLLVIGLILTGYYFKSNADESGEVFIGVGVLIFAFLLMPVFIIHRYRKKDLSKYIYGAEKKDEPQEKDHQ